LTILVQQKPVDLQFKGEDFYKLDRGTNEPAKKNVHHEESYQGISVTEGANIVKEDDFVDSIFVESMDEEEDKNRSEVVSLAQVRSIILLNES
jgi:hypothetical protein